MRSDSGRQDSCESAWAVDIINRCPGACAEAGVGIICDWVWETSDAARLREVNGESDIPD